MHEVHSSAHYCYLCDKELLFELEINFATPRESSFAVRFPPVARKVMDETRLRPYTAARQSTAPHWPSPKKHLFDKLIIEIPEGIRQQVHLVSWRTSPEIYLDIIPVDNFQKMITIEKVLKMFFVT